MKISGQQRKAISPIVATVLIIAATLIAAAAILGYVFGIFGGASNTANVSVVSASCTHGTGTASATCTLSVVNSGSTGVTASGGSITYGGTTYTLTYTALTIPGGQSNPLSVAGLAVTSGGPGAAGQAFNGFLSLNNGAEVSFTGTMN